MTNHQDDYLWDPSSRPDAEIAQLEQLLKPLSATALNLANRELPLPPARIRLQWKRWIPLAAAAMIAGVYFAHVYRLTWTEGAPWPAVLASNGTAHSTLLQVDQTITTSVGQTATLSAARIGKVVVSENSVIRLVQTRKGKHRIDLEHGHLHAKIWAPPNYFGVAHRDMAFLDMGCEFDLKIEQSGSGVLSVASGWVFYEYDDVEQLVPEGYSLTFGEGGSRVPIRTDSPYEFRKWATELDAHLASATLIDQSAPIELARQIAETARDEDYFTLLTLLVRHPQLAQGPLYPRLALALKVDPENEVHRARWAQGDRAARAEWWQRVPKQPKQWWVHWRDAF